MIAKKNPKPKTTSRLGAVTYWDLQGPFRKTPSGILKLRGTRKGNAKAPLPWEELLMFFFKQTVVVLCFVGLGICDVEFDV